MKKVLFLLIISPCLLFAQKRTTATLAITNAQVDTKITAAVSTLNTTIANQGKLIAAQTIIVNNLVADTVAKSNLLTQLTAKNVTQDTVVAQMTRKVSDLFIQNASYKSQLIELYKKGDTAKINGDDLQRQINGVQAMSVQALFDANDHDSIINVPGETILTKKSEKTFSIGIYNYAQLIQRIQTLEAKLTTSK